MLFKSPDKLEDHEYITDDPNKVYMPELIFSKSVQDGDYLDLKSSTIIRPRDLIKDYST